MADQSQHAAIAAPFPAPPPFYHHFTKDNLAQLRHIQKERARSQADNTTSNGNSTTDTNRKPSLDLLALPHELRYLLPPPAPPANTPYRSFGSTINLAAPDLSLQDAGIHQLYSDPPSSQDEEQNPQPHLLAIARSSLTTFLSLVGTLSTNPSLFEERVEDLQTIMYNLHDLVNRYRPHQARESLILMMEERVERMREETRRIMEAKEKVAGLMKGLKEAEEAVVGTEVAAQSVPAREEVGAEENWKTKQASLWKAMDGEMAEVVS